MPVFKGEVDAAPSSPIHLERLAGMACDTTGLMPAARGRSHSNSVPLASLDMTRPIFGTLRLHCSFRGRL